MSQHQVVRTKSGTVRDVRSYCAVVPFLAQRRRHCHARAAAQAGAGRLVSEGVGSFVGSYRRAGPRQDFARNCFGNLD